LYHAFKHYGVGDGLVAVFVPPYAWYRGLHFFYWLAKTDSGKTQITEPLEYPEITPEELSELSAVIGKALEEPINDNDLKRLRECLEGYANRTGLPLFRDESEIKLFTEMIDGIIQYNYELAKCLLLSYDGKQPFISNELKELREKIKLTGLVDEEKLEDDYKEILSVADRDEFTDRFGRTYIISREDIMSGFDEVKVMEENFKKILKVYKEIAAQMK